MISTVIALALLLSNRPLVASDHGLLEKLHELDWSKMDAEALLRSQPRYFKRVDAEIPEQSIYRTGRCEGSIYLIHEETAVYLRLEFEQFVKANDCGNQLRAATVERVLPSDEVERTRIELIAELHAAGPVVGEVDEYQWRSDDSRTKYVLAVFAEDLQEDPLKPSTTRLVAKLRHIPVAPDSVDGIPFRRGYFPPACSP